MYFFFGCLKQPTVSTGPAQRALKKPAAGTAKEAMEQNQPDPLHQAQPTAQVATRVAPQLSMVRMLFKALKYLFSSNSRKYRK